MGLNCYQPFSEGICVGSRCFFAALLGVTQEKTPQSRRKRLAEGAMFSYEDAAKPAVFFLQIMRDKPAGRGSGELLIPVDRHTAYHHPLNAIAQR